MFALTMLFMIFGIAALSSVWNGFVLTILWAWFMVPTFGLPPLALAPAIGVAVVVGYLTHQYRPAESAKDKQLKSALAFMAMRPAFALVVGWIVKQWM